MVTTQHKADAGNYRNSLATKVQLRRDSFDVMLLEDSVVMMISCCKGHGSAQSLVGHMTITRLHCVFVLGMQ